MAAGRGSTPTDYAAWAGARATKSLARGQDRVLVSRRGWLRLTMPVGEVALFNVDAVLEDMSTRTQQRSRAAIERYLGRVLADAPCSAGASLRYVVG